MDPYAISPVERTRHMDQFASLAPPGGMIAGVQAKNYFMQSGLPPMVLAQIWALADMNADGQMDLNEFSIACKLITMKLQGYEIPSTLPGGGLPPNPYGGISHGGMMPAYSMATTMPMGLPMSTGAPMGSVPYSTTMGGMPGQMPGMSMASAYPGTVNTVTPALSSAPVPVVLPMSSTGSSGTPASTPGGAVPWNIPEGTRSKYSNIFFQMDKSRIGFLSGLQARNTLLLTGLPQPTLAQIWSLSDIDGNGKLSCDEFIVSGYLCDLASKGEPLPAKLPPDVVPPSFRPAGAPVPASMAPGVAGSTVSTPGSSRADSVVSPTTFEDKRRENFNKGQAELDKRRQSLIDQQKREEEARQKKAAEEAAAKEKQRQELEKQRILEWEENRKKELNSHRQGEQEKLIQFKAKQTNMKNELDKSRDKIKNLTEEIANCRTGVSEVKAFIDTMRSSRDEKMNNMNGLKQKLKDQNERLLKVTQEKAQMEAKKAALSNEDNSPQITEFEFKRNEKKKKVEETQKVLEELKEKFETVKSEKESKKEALEEHKESLVQIIEACKSLYASFDEKRREIKAEKSKRMRELTDPDHAWGNENEEVIEVVSAPTDGLDDNTVEVYALYEFQPTNDDELAFNAGDKIIVHKNLDPEPGWLGGEAHGKTGWFPESYITYNPADLEALAMAPDPSEAPVAKSIMDWAGDDDPSFSVPKDAELIVFGRPTEEWCFGKLKETNAVGFFPSAILNLNPDEEVNAEDVVLPSEPLLNEMVVALHPYHSIEPGDLIFDEGQKLRVVVKNSEWWTGQFGEKLGVFPSNYVAPEDEVPAVDSGVGTAEAQVDNGNPDVAKPVEEPAVVKVKSKKNKEEKKMELAKVVAPYEGTSAEQLSLAAGQMILIRKKADTGWWQGEIPGGGKGKKRQIGWFPATYVKILDAKEANGASKGLGSVEALFDYEGAREDELSFKQGDIIEMVAKEDGGWWKGRLNGQEGLFPTNFVKEC
ncbi:hypothetical protein TCAL_00936 [Tigriopus californicus]|uniref:Intersectin-1 n=1 Tax=Tigriopus californicus TaxID=6832 RepID=A0A553P7J5_TIGCA|nr:intersectin-1-like [Tigriopus californicus]TRY73656.1 hypothetical protein TCAL_00936 [Tigriopus californicus]